MIAAFKISSQEFFQTPPFIIYLIGLSFCLKNLQQIDIIQNAINQKTLIQFYINFSPTLSQKINKMRSQQIFQAVKKGKNEKVIQFLKTNINDKKSIEIKDSYGWNLIHWAIEKNNLLLVQVLLKTYSEWFLQQKTGSGIFNGEESPLILAAKKKNQQIVLFLLKSGADLSSKQLNEKTAWQILQFNFNQPFLFKALEISQKRKFTYTKATQKFAQGVRFYNINKLKQAQNCFVHSKQYCQTLLQIDVCSQNIYKLKANQIEKYIILIKMSTIIGEVDSLITYCSQFLKQNLIQKARQNIIISRIKSKELYELNIQKFQQYQLQIDKIQALLTLKLKQKQNQFIQNNAAKNGKFMNQIFIKVKFLQLQKESEQIMKKYRKNRSIGLQKIQEVLNKYGQLFQLQQLKTKQQKDLNQNSKNPYNQSKYYQIFRDILSFQKNQNDSNQNFSQFQLKLHYALAVLSQYVYPHHQNQFLKFSHFSNILEISQIAKLDKVWNSHKAGYLAKAFHLRINDKQIVVISHCGTVDTENGDIAADFLLLFDLIHVQLHLAQQFTEKVVGMVKQKNLQVEIYHTGHSLGGVLAQMCALQNDCDAVTFQCPGSYDLFIKTDTRHSRISKVTTYLTAPNFINTLKPHIGKCYRLYNNFPLLLQKDKIPQNDNNEPSNKNTLNSTFIQNKKLTQTKQQPSDTKNILTKGLYKMITTFYDTKNGLANGLAKKGLDMIIPQGLNNLIKRFNTLSGPLAKILQRDINLHSIDSIVNQFQKSVVELAKSEQKSKNFINLNRKLIEQWPIGPFQYFSFMTLMIQENCNQPDQLLRSPAFKYMSKKKNLHYKVKQRESFKARL